MTDQLISFETAKLAKEKGFDKICRYMYNTLNKRNRKITNKEGYLSETKYWISAPTQSLLQKWLREVHKTDIIISIFLDMYIVSIYRYNKVLPIYENGSMKKFIKYEDVLEAGLQRGLKLIK